MECLQNRIESFSKPVRVQNVTKTGAAKNIKWPHPTTFVATPMVLAEAGFYFDPSFEERDNVTCYFCGKELAGWEEQDDPFEFHWKKCAKTCAFALVRCGLREDLDASGRFTFPDKTRLPTSKALEKARLQLYSVGDGWIHDSVRNHSASSKRMAKAGFLYTPQYPGDDLATCLYCSTSLSAWESGDDPLEEHRQRRPECPFFIGSSLASSTKQTRASSKPPSSSQTSTTTRGRNKSVMPMGDIIEETIEPLAPPAKSTSRKASGRSSTRKKTNITVEDEEDAEEEAQAQVVEKQTKKPRSSRTKSLSRSASRKPSSRTKKPEIVEEEEEEDLDVGTEEPITAATMKSTTSKKGSRSRKATATTAAPTDETEDDERVALKKSTRSIKSTRSKNSVVPSPSIEEYATAPEGEASGSDNDGHKVSSLPKAAPRKPTATKKSSSKSQKGPVPLAVDDEGEKAQEEKPTSGKPMTSKKAIRVKKPLSSVVDKGGDDEEEGEMSEKHTAPKKTSKSSKETAQVTDSDEVGEKQTLRKSRALKKSSRAKESALPTSADEQDEQGPTPVPTKKSSRSIQPKLNKSTPIQSVKEETPAEESVSSPPKKQASRSTTKLSRTHSTATLTSTSTDNDGDDDDEEERQPNPKRKLQPKQRVVSNSTSRKTQSVRARTLSPLPPPPVGVQVDDDEEIEEEYVAVMKSGKGKKKPTKQVDVEDEDEEMEEPVVKKSGEGKKTEVAKPMAKVEVDEDEEMEESVVPPKKSKTTVKKSNSLSVANAPKTDSARVVEAEGKVDEDPLTKQNYGSAESRSKSRQLLVSDKPKEETQPVPAPKIPSHDIPRRMVYRSESPSDSDVEMEDATIVLKMKMKQVSTERMRVPSPSPPPAVFQAQHHHDVDNGAESEVEVQADLQNVNLDLDTHMEEPQPLELRKEHEQPLTAVPQGPEHQDDFISFAPRLVTKHTPAGDEQPERPRTPNLAPFKTCDVPIVLGGPEPEEQQQRPPPRTPPRNLSDTTTSLPDANTRATITTGVTTSDVSAKPANASTLTHLSEPSKQSEHQDQEESTIPQFTPFLSKLPFIALHVLSDAELDMTVEEWIRYQMEVEFDKFKRDGERELNRFRRRAEEVRKAIEGL